MKGLVQAVMNEIKNGPATSREISAITGQPLHHVATVLAKKAKKGILQRKRHWLPCRGFRYLYTENSK